jgi:hypothetical protein
MLVVNKKSLIGGTANSDGVMYPSTTELERAFQLAKSGECRSVDEIRKKLGREGYYATQVTGKGLMLQLQAIIAAGLKARNLARERGGGAAAPAQAGAPAEATAMHEKTNRRRSARNGIPVEGLNASNDG